ncbi:hypothetical protein GCM10009422_00420 [Brevundimonas kwangchunensis]|uniref:EF-hand domain-containing protein n=1 Tax=Brevundimonas kwangchunensis TaxID=322163 RepID=A0ABN1GE42_9CAUL
MLTLIALSAVLLQDPPAPPPPPERETRFVFSTMGGDGPGRLDADGDGEVTREEFTAPLNDAFARMDRNGDGRLTGDELPRMMGGDEDITVLRGPGARRFEMRRPGAPGGPEVEFRREGDRTIILSDGEPGERRVTIRRSGEPGTMTFERHEGMPASGRIEAFRAGGAGNARLDTDGDGKVSEAEFLAPLREAFARADKDGSGFIEEGERGEGEVQVFTHRIERREGAE